MGDIWLHIAFGFGGLAIGLPLVWWINDRLDARFWRRMEYGSPGWWKDHPNGV